MFSDYGNDLLNIFDVFFTIIELVAVVVNSLDSAQIELF